MDTLLNQDDRWRLVQAGCIEYMATMPAESVDFSIFSPPFPSLFACTDKECDIGNSESFAGDAKLHLAYFFHQLVRIIKPGRVVIVHCQQIPGLKRNGEFSTIDFRGLLIRLGKRAGFTYDSDWPVTKNPQAQAIRTHSHKLQFASVERDQSVIAPAFNDYLIKFRASGENAVPIEKNLSRSEWIEWAEGVWDWHSISATDTLNTAAGKGEGDTKHICPLQLPVINRCVRMFSNVNDIVFSPFAGIGSEGYVSLLLGRRFFGCEIKDEYIAAARRNLTRAESHEQGQLALFSDEIMEEDRASAPQSA